MATVPRIAKGVPPLREPASALSHGPTAFAPAPGAVARALIATLPAALFALCLVGLHPGPVAAQCFSAELSMCGAECDAWQTISGSIVPGGSVGYQFRSGAGCTVTFSTCGNGGTASFAPSITIWDSTCTNSFAGAVWTCDTLAELSWTVDQQGPFIVKVGGVGAGAGSYTLAYHCHCDPLPYVGFVENAFQDYQARFHGEGSYSYLGPIASYTWDFGDGGSGSGPSPTHAYSQQGTYYVQLDVTDACGNTATAYGEANVLDCDANPNAPALAPAVVESLDPGTPPPPRRFASDLRLTQSPGPEVIGYQSMAVDTAGDLHVAYSVSRFPPYFDPGESSIYHRTFSANTATWTVEDRAASIPTAQSVRSVGMAADSVGNLHVVWSQRDNTDVTEIWYVRRQPNLAWDAPHRLRNTAGYVSSQPAIAADAHGNVYVAWGEGELAYSNVYYTLWKADAQAWSPTPQALTNFADGHVTDVGVTTEDDLSPAIEIVHFAWTQLGNAGEGVAHTMLAIKEPSGQTHLQGVPDFIPWGMPCGLQICSSGAGLHMLFSSCFIGKPDRLSSEGGASHFVGVTTPGQPNGWPTFALPSEPIPSEMKRAPVSAVVADRSGNLHTIVGDWTQLTWHSEWSAKDSVWSSGDVVRDVASGYDLTSAIAVDHEYRVHAAWLDHRAPDSPCSGEAYYDIGVCSTPQMPESLQVVNVGTGHQLQLEWKYGSDPEATACRYVIYRAKTTDAVYDSVADVSTAPWLDRDDLVRGASYTYRIRPYNLCEESGDTTDAVVGIPRFPLVMVHGCCGGGPNTTWAAMRQYLTTFGPQAYAWQDVWAVDYDGWGHLINGGDSLKVFADDSVLAHYRDAYGVRADTVDIVAHSMGGIVSRLYLHSWRRPVGTLVTLGSPHAGTDMRVLEGAQISSLVQRRKRAEGLFDLSEPYMRALNRVLMDTPLTGNAWTQWTPPSYHLAAGRSRVGGLCKGPNDDVVPVFSALYPVGCESITFESMSHTQLNKDLTRAAPWVRDRLLRDSLHVSGAPFMRMPAAPLADSTAIVDSLALRPFAYAGTHELDPSEAVEDTVVLDGVSTAWFVSLRFAGTATLTLRDPSGQVIDPARAASDPAIDYDEASGDEEDLLTYQVDNPAPGTWIMTTTALTVSEPGETFLSLCTVESPVRVDLELPQRTLLAGESVPLIMRVRSGAQPALGCAVSARVFLPDSTEAVLSLFDDGAHGDGAADDGTYGSVPLPLSLNGNYAVQATATGTASPGGAFARRTHGVLFVGDRLPPGIRLLSPIGGELLLRNSTQSARWDAVDDTGIDSVLVELSLDDGAAYTRLGIAAGSDTAFAWTTPDTITTHARIRVTAYDPLQQSRSDASRTSFSISDLAGVRTPQVPNTRPALGRTFPNPFRSGTTIEFSLPQPAMVKLTVFDVAGRRVKTLVDDPRGPGLHRVGWRGDTDAGVQASSGVYFVQLNVGPTRIARKLLILK